MVETSQFIDRIGIELRRTGFYNNFQENDFLTVGKSEQNN